MVFYIYVKGYSSETTQVDLIMYFQSKESGGGDVDDEECKFEKGKAIIAFDDEEDQKNVLKNHDHVLKDCKLTISLEPFTTKPKAKPREQKKKEDKTPPKPANDEPIIGEIKTVIVTGISPDTSDSTLQFFFENKKRSGGGDIESFQRTEPQLAYITFTSAQVASSVLGKGNLEIDGYLLQLRAKKPKVTFPKDKRKLFIENLDPKTTKDGLTNYVELITELDVKDLVFGNDNNAMVILDDEPDMNKATQKAKKKPLEGVVLKISNPPICHSVLMTGFNQETTKNAIELKYENPKYGGGEILDVVYQQEEGKAVISFFEPNVIQSMISQEHILNGAKITVRPYYPFLDEKVTDVARNIKKAIQVSPDVMDHVSNRCDKEFLQEFGFDVETAKYDEDKKQLTFPTTLPTGELIEKKIEAIESYFNQFTAKEVEIPKSLYLKSIDEVKERLNEAMKDFRNEIYASIEDDKQCIVVTGKKEKFVKFEKALQKELNELEKKKEMITTRLSLEQRKLMLILSGGFEKRFESETDIEVKIDPPNGTLTLKGSKELVESARIQAYEEYSKIKEEFIDLSERQEEYLMSGGSGKINDGLKKRKLEALVCLDKSKPRKAIVEFLSTTTFKDVKEYLLDQVSEECFTVEEESADLLKSEKWTTFQNNLEQDSVVKMFTVGHSEVNVWLTGEKSQVQKAHENLKQFVNVNTIISESINLDETIARHLPRFCKRDMNNIEVNLKNHMVKFEIEESLTVRGTKEGVRQAKALLQEVIDNLAYRKIFLEKPGMQKYLESETGRTSLGGVETQYNCTITLTTDRKERSTQISSVVNPRASNPSTMLLCSYETPEKVLLKVYQDDITTHACDVIVNAANGDLQHIGGLAKMIVDKGGREIQEDSDEYKRKNGTIYPGECYKGIPGKLPCKHVIHTVAPRWDNSNQGRDRKYLEFACENTLEAAKIHSSIALPAIGSGVFNVPKDVCADVMVEAAVNFSLKNGRRSALKEIHFVNNDSTTVQIFLKEFRKRFGREPTFKEILSRPVSASRFNQDESRDKRRQFEEVTEIMNESLEAPKVLQNADRITTNTKTTISVVVGDLSTHQADVLVNTTSENLKLHSNPCSRAMSNEAGPVLQQECNKVGKLNVGEVAFTKGGNLLCQNVCHVICTQWNNGQGEKVLRSIIQNCLTKAQSRGMKSIAFPAIGTGILGFPHDLTAKICFEECKEFDKKNPNTCLKDIHFVVYHQDQASIKAFQDELRKQPEWRQTPSEVGEKEERVSRKKRRRPIAESSSKDKHAEMAKEVEISEARAPSQPPLITEKDNGTISIFVRDGVKIHVVRGDITKQNTDVIAHMSNPDMSMAGGVAKALIKKGGEEIKEETKKETQVAKYSTVLTTAGRLQAKYIAHMAGPDSPNSNDIEKCITNCLKETTDRNCTTISIPAIATGQLNMPAEKSAKAMLTAIVKFLQISPGSLSTVRIVIYDEEIFKKFSKAVKKLLQPESGQSQGFWRSLFNTIVGFWQSDSELTKEKDEWQKPQLFLEIFAEKEETLTKVVNHIDRIMNEQMKKEVIEDDLVMKLSDAHVSQIMNVGKEKNVEVTMQKRVNRIIVYGHTEDVSAVILEIKSFLNDVKLAEKENENAEMVSQGVQWYWKDTDDSQEKYDVANNSKIEKAYMKKKKSVTFVLEEGKCEIIFDDMQETNLTTNEKAKVFRKDLKAKTEVAVPDYWDPQPKTNGKEDPLHIVQLDPTKHNTEYKNISDSFKKTANTHTILKIERIQNPPLFKLYATKKLSMDEQDGSNEKFLYHGTTANNVSEINQNGLNRSYRGAHGTVWGQGIYFATNASMSVGYAKQDASGTRYMYVARVAAGQFIVGSTEMIVPPTKTGNIKYDSVVDNVANPSIFVMFYDNQYYPEYLITFK